MKGVRNNLIGENPRVPGRREAKHSSGSARRFVDRRHLTTISPIGRSVKVGTTLQTTTWATVTTLAAVSRIFTTSFSSVYPLYVAKVEKKDRTKAELDTVIEWLTGFSPSQLRDHLASGTTFEDFFDDAHLNPNVALITGTICGVRVEEIDDPLMQKIRYLDKLVDELAKGKPMGKVLREPA